MIAFGRSFASERFGSRRALARFIAQSIASRFGRNREYASFDAYAVERVVFICQGNICRSAFGQAVASSLGWDADSAGLDTAGGDQADDVAYRIAAKMGYDLSGHVTKKISDLTLQSGDLVVCVEPSHARAVDQMYSDSGIQVALLGLLGPSYRPYLPDPYGKPYEYYSRCFKWIEADVRNLDRRLKKATDER